MSVVVAVADTEEAEAVIGEAEQEEDLMAAAVAHGRVLEEEVFLVFSIFMSFIKYFMIYILYDYDLYD
jgi:hypothetical protein